MFKISSIVLFLFLILSVYAENGDIVNNYLTYFFAMYLQLVLFIALVILIGNDYNMVLLLVWLYIEMEFIKNCLIYI